ncbi:O-methyltransferase [Adhaeribacter rhizoryzae]|uniref:Methyltransferase domain-containing protein n=1 Tax=Adhaeribacter rhizoryzae TaxID=2607907 RepID=A0A5M6DM87_9BACT|nr:O-methyltransferase [Adhaeribacter rhizoryzae]KAA5548668.1 methyltransferase domain-containing protein [Adhaeribacter rhizoryzae]
MDFLSKELQDYVLRHTSPEPELLQQLNRETYLKVLMPRMLSGHYQGRVLSMLSHMIKPKQILEIGTYTGYSGLCLAEGLTPDGQLHTIDINDELEDLVRKYVAAAGLENQINYYLGNALEIIPTLNIQFDLVFIDADKINYSRYYDLVLEKTNPGGYILADNVLWSGKVVQEPGKKIDKDTQAILDFNLKIQQDDRVENVLLPLRDGLLLMRKK